MSEKLTHQATDTASAALLKVEQAIVQRLKERAEGHRKLALAYHDKHTMRDSHNLYASAFDDAIVTVDVCFKSASLPAPATDSTALLKALRYAILLVRERVGVEAPYNARIVAGMVVTLENHVEALASLPAPAAPVAPTDKAVNEAIDALAEKAKRGIRASSSSGVAYGDRAVIDRQAELLKRVLAAPATPEEETYHREVDVSLKNTAKEGSRDELTATPPE